MSEFVQRFGRNLRGCDFVVSDIHGCFDQLRHALDDMHFVPETDRLFSVGDLIDRGPKSTEALKWVAERWFHAIIGNHEDMVLKSLHDEDARLGWVLLNGGAWWLTLDTAARMQYISAFRQLPVANVWFIDTGAFLADKGFGHLTLLTLGSLFKHTHSTPVNQDQIP